MDGHCQRVVIDSSMFRWMLLLCKVFINDIDGGVECTFSKFSVDTKLSGSADALEERDATQRNLGRLEKWAHMNLMRISKVKCKMLHLGHGNPRYRKRTH